MHESVVTLQTLIADEREAVRAMAAALDQAGTRDVALINRAHLEEQIRTRTKRCDALADLIAEYASAKADSTDAALKLVLIQYAAASMVEARNAGETPDDW